LLKNLAVTGATTTIITIGIGIDISVQELQRLASAPGNSFIIPNTGNLTSPFTEQQLINSVFGKKVTVRTNKPLNCKIVDINSRAKSMPVNHTSVVGY